MAEDIITMKMEINLADYYRQDLILVSKLSIYTGIINYSSWWQD